MESLKVSLYIICSLQIVTVVLLPFQFGFNFFSSHLIALDKFSNTVLNKNGALYFLSSNLHFSVMIISTLNIKSRSVQFSCSVMSDSLQPHGLQHATPPCPSPAPGAYPNSGSLSWWCHSTISSSVVPFSCPQSLPSSGSFKWVSSSHEVAKVLEFQLQH